MASTIPKMTTVRVENKNIEHGLGEETLDAVVVFDAAYQVACQFAVKEPHGQPHQLGEEIRDERHVARVLMWSSIQRRITSISVRLNTSMSCGGQNELYKIQIPVPYALVYNSLGEKREDQLQQTACQQADDELHHRLFVGTYIVKQIPQGQFFIFLWVPLHKNCGVTSSKRAIPFSIPPCVVLIQHFFNSCSSYFSNP